MSKFILNITNKLSSAILIAILILSPLSIINTASATPSSAPSIIAQPISDIVATVGQINDLPSISVTATSTGGSLSYQWQKATTSNQDDSFQNIINATASTYQVQANEVYMQGISYYRVILGNQEADKDLATTTSNNSTLTISSVIPENVSVQGVTVNPTTLSLTVGATSTISATVSPASSTDTTVTWSSSNNSIATVNATTGLVTAISAGTAIITATALDGSSITATTIITVSNPVVSVSGISLSTSSLSLLTGATSTITGIVTPSDATNKNINWTSSNPSVAELSYDYTNSILGTTGSNPLSMTIDREGNIYTANIDSNNVSKITPTGTSTIFGETGSSPSSIAIDKKGNIYTANRESNTVTKITPTGASTTFETNLSVPTAITVDRHGNIYVANSGSRNITKITPSGTSTTFGETGITGVQSNYIFVDNQDNVYLFNNFLYNLSSQGITKITPSGISTTSEVYSISSIVVDNDGNIYAANYASNTVVKITPSGTSTTFGTTGPDPKSITLDNEGNIYTVNRASNTVSKITPTGVSTILGETGEYPSSIITDNEGNIYTANSGWGSNNVSKFTRSAPIITAIAPGTSTVTATTADGGFSATSIVTVSNPVIPNPEIPVSSIFIYPSPLTYSLPLTTGETFTLSAIASPEDATNKNVTWTSSNEWITTVNATTGLVTAISAGTATITATAINGVSGTKTIIVTDPIILTTGISVSTSSLSLTTGATSSITAEITPLNSPKQNINWSSSNPSVVGLSNSYISNTLGTTGSHPYSIITDKQGNIYTANWGSDTVTKINPTTGISTTFSTIGTRPSNITIDNEDNIYTLNQTSNNITKITPSGTSTIVGTIGFYPSGIVRDNQGNIYTLKSASNTVYKITPTGTSTVFGETGSTPSSITIDNQGNIYTANWGSNNVSKITPTGTSTTFGTTGSYPNSITVDNEGNIYTVNYGSNNVSKITTTGTSTTFGTTGSYPSSIIIDNEGNIYTTNYASNTIIKITPSGTSTVFAETGHGPSSITIDNQGNIYTGNNGSNNVSKISKGVILTAITPGTSTITATTADGIFSATSIVAVSNPIQVLGISLSPTSTTLLTGATTSISATVTPNTATNKNLTWSSSDNSVASVGTTTGLVTAISAGTAIITATALDGSSITATTIITVSNPVVSVSGISLSTSSLSLLTGATSTITGIVTPSDATNKNINWTSSNPSVAELSYDYTNSILDTTGSYPRSITMDNEGNIYTANYYSNNVSKITPSGTSTIFGETGSSPTSIVIDREGNIYTANSASNTVSKITPTGVSTILGTTGEGPLKIIIDKQGNIYVLNQFSDYLSKITPTGTSTSFGKIPLCPYDMVIDSQENIYVMNCFSSNGITKITPAGISTQFSTTSRSVGKMAIDNEDNIYVAHSGLVDTSKITPAGVVSILSGVQQVDSDSITTDNEGNIYIVNITSNTVSKITPTGVSTVLGTTGSYPGFIITDNEGNIYTANSGSNNVSKFKRSAPIVTAISAGTSTITATALDGSSVTATAIVTVSNPVVQVLGISLSPTTTTLLTGATTSIAFTVTPNNANNRDLTWSSSDNSVATVGTTTGVVTAITAGTATITATTLDGTSISATTFVTVTALVTPPSIIYTHITSISQLQAINNNLTGNYILDNDLDLSSIPNFTPIGSSASPFYGTFNGNGHTISNLKISAGENTGLFGYTASSSRIENFTISNPNIIGGNNTASAIGYNQGIVNNIGIINGNISSDGTYTGGVIGHSKGTTTNVYYIGNITGKGVGGVIGLLESTTLSNSFSRGNIITSVGYASNNTPSGGIVASLSSATINNSYSLSSLYGNRSFLAGMAGFVWDGNINNSYSDSYMTGGYSDLSAYSTGGITSRIGNNEGGRNVSVSNVYYNNANKGYEQANGRGQFNSINPPNSAVPQSVLYSSTTLSLGNQFQLTTSGNNNYPAVLNSSTGQILGGSNQFVQVSAPVITLPAQTTYNYTTGPTAPKFNVSVIALPVPTYKWERSTSTNGVYSHLSDGFEYAPDITISGTYYYRLITTNTIGSSTSSPIEVITIAGSAATPTIISQPSNQTLALGATTTLSIIATSTSGTLAYNWYYSNDNVDWNDLASANTATTSSDFDVAHTANGAFDGNPATPWAPVGTAGWAQVKYYKPVKLSKYSIRARAAAGFLPHSPKKWDVQGSNDESSWVIIDSRANETNWTPGGTNSYNATTTTAYRYYRFNFQEVQSGDQLSFTDINLFENDTLVPFSINRNSNTLEYTQSSASILWYRVSIINTELYKSTTTIISTPFSLSAAAQRVASISGSISYYASSTKPIVGAQIYLTDTDNNTLVSTTTTNNTGAYTFNNVSTGGNYKLSATYTGASSTTGININDNVRNAQIIVGTYTPTDDAKISADTNQDGIININDNVRNAQIIVGTYILPIPFIFIPTDKTNLNATSTENSITKKNYLWPSYQSKTITNLNSDTTINFKGYKVGDSNGDWR